MHRTTGNLLLSLVLFATACAEEEAELHWSGDSVVDASTVADASTSDAGASDAGKSMDGALTQDSGAQDTGTADTSTGTDGATQDAAVGDARVGDAGNDAAAPAATFTRVHEILKSNCMDCHNPNSAGMLSFAGTKEATREALVGVSSKVEACNGRTRVVASNPDTSLLVVKLEGGANLCGDRMPDTKPALSPALIAEIRSWIAAGALNN